MRRLAAKLLAVAGLCAQLASCGLTPFGRDDLDSGTTGSITPAAVPPPLPASTATAAAGAQAMPPPVAAPVVDALADSDWQAIRAAAASGMTSAATGATLDWSNLDTGNSGTLAPLAEMKRSGALSCRAFALTVSDVRGIRRYHGDACRSASDAWQLFNMTADDKTLL